MPHVTLFILSQKHPSCHGDLSSLRRAEADVSIHKCAVIFVLEYVFEDLDYLPSWFRLCRMKHQMWLKIYEEVGIATAFSVTETHCWCFHLFSASSKWQNRVWSHSDPNQCKQHQHEWLTNIWASNQLCLLVFPAVWIFYWIRIELHAEVIIHAHPQLRYPDVSNMCPPPPKRHSWLLPGVIICAAEILYISSSAPLWSATMTAVSEGLLSFLW